LEDVYPNTVLRFDGDDVVVDLRRPLGPAERDELARVGLTGAFAVLSAHPSFDRRGSSDDGERLTHRLRVVIAAFGVPPVPVLAGSPDGAHREPSLAAALERRDALNIARLFEQDAQFWFDGETMWIDWTDGRAPTRLPVERTDAAFRVRNLRANVDESGGH